MYFYDFDIKNNEMWFPEFYTGAICKVNIDTFLLDIFENDVLDFVTEKCPFCGIYKGEKRVLLSSKVNNNVYVYNIEEKKYVVRHVQGMPNKVAIVFSHDEVFLYNNNLYIVLDNGIIIKADIELERINYVGKCPNNQNEIHGQVLSKEENLYIPIENTIFVFDMNTENITKEIRLDDIDRIATLGFDGNRFWITSASGLLMSLGEEKQKFELDINDYYCESFPHGIRFWRSFINLNKLWLIPCYSESIYCIDLVTGTLKKIVIDGEEENEYTFHSRGRLNAKKIISTYCEGGYLWILSSKTKKLYKINQKTDEVIICNMDYSLEETLKKQLNAKSLILEGALNCTLRQFLKVIE